MVDFTHFKRKRSLKIDRATFCTEWKSALIQIVWKSGQIPDVWKEAVTILIHKKDSPDNP